MQTMKTWLMLNITLMRQQHMPHYDYHGKNIQPKGQNRGTLSEAAHMLLQVYLRADTPMGPGHWTVFSFSHSARQGKALSSFKFDYNLGVLTDN